MRFVKPTRSICLALVGAAALFLYTGLALYWHRDSLLRHSDELFFRLWVTESFRYASSPLDVSIISPVQGLGGLTQPLGAWLHPGILPGRLFGDVVSARVASYVAMIVAYSVATFFLGRVAGLSIRLAIVAAQIAGIVFFPPGSLQCYSILGFRLALDYYMTPALAFPVVLGTLFVGTFMLLGTRSRVANIACVVALPLLILYSVACDPLYTSITMIGPAFLVLGTAAGSGTWRTLVWRLAGLGACLVVGLGARLPELYWAYSNYSARTVFSNEIASGSAQDFVTGAAMFRGAGPALTGLVLMLSCVALVRFGSRKQKAFGAALLGFQVFVAGLTLVYVFSGIRWPLPTPDYFEQGVAPAFLVALFLAAQDAWPKIWPRLRKLAEVEAPPPSDGEEPPATDSREQTGDTLEAEGVPGAKSPEDPRRRLPLASYGSVITAPAIALFVVFLWQLDTTGSAQQIDGPKGPIVPYLVDKLAIPPHSEFQGNVVTVAGIPGGPIANSIGIEGARSESAYKLTEGYINDTFDHRLGIRGLWTLNVPTLEHNSQLMTTQRYFLFSRALARPIDYQYTNYSLVTLARPNLMAAMGTRFLITDEPHPDDPRLSLCLTQTNEFWMDLMLYEIANPNTGDYSPTRLRVVRTAGEMVRLMISDEFSFEEEAIVHQPLESAATLVRAKYGKMFFERGGVRIKAESPGTSLLVLPLEYSHSLQILSHDGASQQPRLLRVNLLQTGVLFSGKLDMKIAHVFGLFRGIDGRKRDIIECRELGIVETGEVPYPPNQLPYASASALSGD